MSRTNIFMATAAAARPSSAAWRAGSCRAIEAPSMLKAPFDLPENMLQELIQFGEGLNRCGHIMQKGQFAVGKRKFLQFGLPDAHR